MKQYFLKLYQYNAWANNQVLKCLINHSVAVEIALSIMSHLLAAPFIWLNRIKGLPKSDVKLWETQDLDTLQQMAKDGAAIWLEFIENTESFDRELSYTNYIGNSYVTNVEQIMIHLVNHSSYHRGQVALRVRQLGFQPVNTDYITYDRVITGQLKVE
jgi:uncharacterized damage-inducible protein DinB